MPFIGISFTSGCTVKVLCFLNPVFVPNLVYMSFLEYIFRLVLLFVLPLIVPYIHYRTGKKGLKIIGIIISGGITFFFLCTTAALMWIHLHGTSQRKESYILWIVALLLSIASFYLSLKTQKKEKLDSSTLD